MRYIYLKSEVIEKMKGSSLRLSLISLLIVSIMITLPGCTGDSSEDTEIPVTTEFARMLGFVPYSFLEEHDIWFSNWAKAKQIHGVVGVNSIAEVMSLPEEELEAFAEASMDISPSSWSNPELEPIIGFDGMTVDRMVFTEIITPRSFYLSEGNFDEELITGKLTGLDYSKIEYGAHTYYGTGEDHKISLENELTRITGGRMNVMAVFDNTIMAAPAGKYVTGMFDARDGNVPTIIDNTACRVLADSLGDVLTAVMTIPERILITDLRMRGLPKFDFTVPDDWGLLHQYDMAALGLRDEGEKRFLVIALYYADESAAREDGVAIIKRMETYTLGTWLPQMENIPFSQRYKAGEPVIEQYPEGVVSTIACQIMPEERRGVPMNMGVGGGLRDFLFLAPDPSVYVGKNEVPKLSFGS